MDLEKIMQADVARLRISMASQYHEGFMNHTWVYGMYTGKAQSQEFSFIVFDKDYEYSLDLMDCPPEALHVASLPNNPSKWLQPMDEWLVAQLLEQEAERIVELQRKGIFEGVTFMGYGLRFEGDTAFVQDGEVKKLILPTLKPEAILERYRFPELRSA